MKKKVSIIAVIFTLFLTTVVLSSVAFARCTLNRQEFGLIGNNGSTEVYIDIPSVENIRNIVEAGSCFYFPGGVECGMKHRGSKSEHYHFILYHINYNFNSAGIRAYMIKDSLGNEITSDFFEDDEIKYRPIPRNTLFEKFCLTALKIAGR